jgi:hypothetical protein
MNIKLNKYVNHFKATSILCLCVNKIIFLSYTLLFSSLSCCKDNCYCHSTSDNVSFFTTTIIHRYSNPFMLFTGSLIWIPQWVVSSCLLFHSCVSVHLFSDLCFMFCASHIDFVFPVVCATPLLFIYTEGSNCDICKKKCSYCCMLTFSCGVV